ncbi:transferrin receptor-like dimerization domain-containing protein [Polymorphobacter fuscus]|uniref:M28 family peptidase n=1 Tax=Sandarakinorhabdus fusca TaxID=1439888 RepID=A0A7C9KHT6_9SPHN|nr:transferrin receptor-like dimerization domain-containing protein [Polymorphobacter fuscus]KAB7647430.1 M28 family peptidase [Polymorphobacter fuscus]MQT16679.1 M28 family peptidase [Polymorphobacter fuscus]NJC09336.1 N-acetylated-alpha-linked acidic dipeptidase [Polymorphobacter fuscus]
MTVLKTLALAALLGTSAMAQVTPQQAALEKTLDAGISSADQMAWLKQMSSAPNHVGSAHNKENAEFLLAKFKEFGWDAKIEQFDVLYPTPISTTLEITGPNPVKLGGQEPTIPEDSTSGNLKDALPPYVAFQGDGDVTAPVVYVNYGLPADYEALARRGIDVKGKIALARYGGGWRGLKPKLAQEHGAVGTLIYSDPANDGYATAETYPNGGARPDTGVQRGSVADMTVYPGDPTTPGYGSVPGAKHIARADAPTILKIPVLPISYGDASKIFAAMGGPLAPDNFKGALPFAYRLGGDDTSKVHLAVKSDWSLKPLYDVVATIKGKDRPDEWVVRGNHHDGWVFGASDPLSGDVAMLSEAKALGQLKKAGWQPSRTIVYTSWDGEEPMLLGSTEWAETHAAELQKKAVIYINTDGNSRGFLGADGSHQWQHVVSQVAADVKDPQTGATVLDRARAKVRADAFDGARVNEAEVKAAEAGGDLPMGALGSGSDYSSFLQHLGVPSLNIGYGGEGEGAGSYHSIYDSYDHFTRFEDPGLAYGKALSETVGRLVLRIADADTPPVRFTDLATTVRGYLTEVKTLVDTRRKQDEKRAALLSSGAFRLASDPKAPVTAPPAEAPTPVIEMAALENAVGRLEASAKAFDAAYAARGAGLAPAARGKLNAALIGIDQALLIPEGLPGRNWYKHALYAPGRFTGYGAKTLPGVREAVEERRFADANLYATRTAAAIDRLSARLDAARAIIG